MILLLSTLLQILKHDVISNPDYDKIVQDGNARNELYNNYYKSGKNVDLAFNIHMNNFKHILTYELINSNGFQPWTDVMYKIRLTQYFQYNYKYVIATNASEYESLATFCRRIQKDMPQKEKPLYGVYGSGKHHIDLIRAAYNAAIEDTNIQEWIERKRLSNQSTIEIIDDGGADSDSTVTDKLNTIIETTHNLKKIEHQSDLNRYKEQKRIINNRKLSSGTCLSLSY